MFRPGNICLGILLALSSSGLFAQDTFYQEGKTREIRIYFRESNWDHILDSLFINFGDEGRLIADVSIEGKMLKDVGIRFKGYSSWNIDRRKNPFNIDLDYIHSNQNFDGYTKIKLSNVISDPSFIREALSYEIARKYLPSSQANFANVYINDSLYGLYSNVEAVDKKFVLKHYGSNSNCFFKGSPEKLEYPFGGNSNLAYSHGSDTNGYYKYYQLESGWGWSELLKLIYTLNKDTSEIESILNVDRTLWMHAFNYALLNLDSYIGYSQNYYIYQDDNGRFNPVIWDLNMSFGSFRESDGSTHFKGISIKDIKVLDPLQHLTFSVSPRPLISNIIADSTLRRMYLAHLRTIIKENFKNNLYYTRGKEIQDVIDSYVFADSNKLTDYSDFRANLDTITGSGSDQVPGIKDLMEARMAYLDTFPGFYGEPEVISIDHFPEFPEKNKTAYITAKISGSVNVYLFIRYSGRTVFIKKMMFDDGKHGDSIAGDHLYGTDFIPDGNIIQYYIYAENSRAGVFSPERAAYNYYSIQPLLTKGNLVINEIMTINDNIVSDQDGQFDPWIELVNTGDENIRLSGCVLGYDENGYTKYSFPDTSILARKYLVIWADAETSQAGLHANFKLNENAGKLVLLNQKNKIIDTVIYGNQEKLKSYGRYPNGTGGFTFMKPSFSKYNTTGTMPENDFVLFPNPAREKLSIELKNSSENVSIIIFNSTGQVMMQAELDPQLAAVTGICAEFDLSVYRKGVYCMKIIDGNQQYYKKFVVFP